MESLVRTFKTVVSSVGNELLDAPTCLSEQHSGGVANGVRGSENPGDMGQTVTYLPAGCPRDLVRPAQYLTISRED
jgi:hypothetical protein